LYVVKEQEDITPNIDTANFSTEHEPHDTTWNNRGDTVDHPEVPECKYNSVWVANATVRAKISEMLQSESADVTNEVHASDTENLGTVGPTMVSS
jgi:hypothetical protein